MRVEVTGIVHSRARLRVTFSGDFRETVKESPVQAIKLCSFAI